MGLMIGWGNLSGVVSSNIYRSNDAPQYYPGHGIILAYLFIFLLGGSILQYFLLRWENRKRRSGKRDDWVTGLDEHQLYQRGDMRPDFIYTM